MEGFGINKRLYDRRLELKYSKKEACIRLDISKIKLSLIENGYIRVNNPDLQEMFIAKYKLEKDFFTKYDFKLYPTPIEAQKKRNKNNSFLNKIFRSIWFKICCFILFGGFTSMAVTGKALTPRTVNNVNTFFSTTINDCYTNAVTNKKGIHHDAFEAYTSSILGDDFYSIEEISALEIDPDLTGFWRNSVNFLANKEYIGYTFFFGETIISDEDFFYGMPISCTYESRIQNGAPRIHFNAYPIYLNEITGDYFIDYFTTLAHISADLNSNNKSFTYNLIETLDIFTGNLVPVNENDLDYLIYTHLFDTQYSQFTIGQDQLFKNHKTDLNVSYLEFYNDLIVGNNAYDGFSKTINNLIVFGLIFACLFFALFVFSFIKTFVYKYKNENINNDEIKDCQNFDIVKKELPRDIKIQPFIPEIAMRLLILFVAFLSSLGIYYIFQSIVTEDPIAMFSGIAFKMEIAGFSTVSVLLLFFLKLDIRQAKKNSFLINYMLFFVGLIFYFLLLIAQSTLLQAKTGAAPVIAEALNYLPGNIIWGILAFNLLSVFLFGETKSIQNNDKKRFRYRLLAIIPIAYMVISSVYQIGRKTSGWNWPLAVSSLLFSKALFLTLFSVLYCLVVFFYKRHTEKKFGLENAKIYQNGNRYHFIKNLLVIAVIAALGIADLLIGKFWTNNPLDAGGNYVVLYMIPFVLFYRPHMGKRNGKWDLVFTIFYGLCLSLGLLLVVGSLSTYITSL